MRLGSRTLVGLVVLALVGCGTGKPRPARIDTPTFQPEDREDVIYLQPPPLSKRSVVTKDYTIGTRRRAGVGEPMVGVRNYVAAERPQVATAIQFFQQNCRTAEEAGTNDLEVLGCRSGRLAGLRGRPGDRYPIVGSTTEGGETYYFLEIPARGGSLYLGVDGAGRIKRGRYVAWADAGAPPTPVGQAAYYQRTPVPMRSEGPTFRFESVETISPGGDNYVHYEVVYGGTTYDYRGMVYHLIYKEFRRDDSSRPVYQQDLEFVGNVTTFDVLGLRIRVHDVNEDEIIYSVLRD